MQYHNDKCNLELVEVLQARQPDWQQIRTMQRVREGVKLRLEMNIPYIGTLSGSPLLLQFTCCQVCSYDA